MANFRDIAIDEFYKITNFDLSRYLADYVNFNNLARPNIVKWYDGTSTKPEPNSFKFLNNLIERSNIITNLYQQYKNSFKNSYHWSLLEDLEDIKESLITTTNLSRLLRSFRLDSNDSYNTTNYNMKLYDTLESVQRVKVSEDNFDNDWINLAIENNLFETDYDSNGGVVLKMDKTYQKIFLQSVVDNPIGEKLYGLDINRKITFVDDDILVLDYRQTALQSVEILSEIKIGSVPQYPTLGLQESVTVGSNRNSFSSPLITRQMTKVFDTDDSLKDFKILGLTNNQDSVLIQFKVNTVAGDIIVENL